ncbi:MAG: hypothetical protein NT009_00870 [Proteobacteria bacterium]|nr:hypothetical protein [Pseudomonadota bacterium]
METRKPMEVVEEGLAEFGRGNRDKARQIFSQVLATAPGNRQAADYLTFIEEQEKADLQELGDLKKAPIVALSYQEILQLKISPQIGYILSLTDGFLTFEEIIASSGLGPEETKRGLARLKRMGVIQVI